MAMGLPESRVSLGYEQICTAQEVLYHLLNRGINDRDVFSRVSGRHTERCLTCEPYGVALSGGMPQPSTDRFPRRQDAQ